MKRSDELEKFVQRGRDTQRAIDELGPQANGRRLAIDEQGPQANGRHASLAIAVEDEHSESAHTLIEIPGRVVVRDGGSTVLVRITTAQSDHLFMRLGDALHERQTREGGS